jgi:hypothetical protein
MEIRTQSKTGPVVASLDDITADLSQQTDSLKRRWREQLAHDPSSFARLEVEIHDHFRHLADQMTATLLAEATPPGAEPVPGEKGAPAVPSDRDAPRRRGA